MWLSFFEACIQLLFCILFIYFQNHFVALNGTKRLEKQKNLIYRKENPRICTIGCDGTSQILYYTKISTSILLVIIWWHPIFNFGYWFVY